MKKEDILSLKDMLNIKNIVYLITNKINRKEYVGITQTTLKKRLSRHAEKSNKKNSLIKRAIRKYGKNNFQITILKQETSKKKLLKIEKIFIEKLNTLNPHGYNLVKESFSIPSRENKNLSTSKKVDKYDIKGNFVETYNSLNEAGEKNKKTRGAISACCNKKNQQTNDGFVFRFHEETKGKEKIEITLKKRNRNPHSKKTKKKIGQANKGNNSKKIDQYTLNGKFIKTYNSITEIAKKYKITKTPIGLCCNKINKTSIGYVWRFHEETQAQQEIEAEVEKICQYSIDGNLINYFYKMGDAMKQNKNISSECINKCLSGKFKTAGGFIWSKTTKNQPDLKIMVKINLNKTRLRSVDQYDLKGNYITTFNSIKEASKKLELNSSSISKCCRQKQRWVGEFVFKYHIQIF